MLNQTFLELYWHFWAYTRCAKLTFSGFLPYQSSCDRGELILCYNKPRRDVDFKQRPSLAYYNKGSARFIITKAFFAYVISRKWRTTQWKKLQGNVSQKTGRPHAKIQAFSQQLFFHLNRHLHGFALTPSIVLFLLHANIARYFYFLVTKDNLTILFFTTE